MDLREKMSDLCLSNTLKTTQFSNRLLSDLQLFFNFILSHPLYFSYFIFFSPYLLKLLSFLSPLFITTSLLLLAFLTLSPGFAHKDSPLRFSESKLGFLLSAYESVSERLRSSKTYNEDEEFLQFEELEVYKIVFDTSNFYDSEKSDEVAETKSDEDCFRFLETPAPESSGDGGYSNLSTLESLFANLEEKTVEVDWEEDGTEPVKQANKIEGLLKELDEFEKRVFTVDEKKVEVPGANSNKVELASAKSNKVEENKEEILVKTRSKAAGDKVMNVGVKVSTDNGGEYTSVVVADSQKPHANVGISTYNGGEYTSKFLESPSSRSLDSNLGAYGSMRREKEWKRTLACKLFEERHNADGGNGGEGMDSLWETYEADPSLKVKPKSTPKKKNKKKGESEYYEKDDYEEEEEDVDAQLCCLQALKFSAGKMNLGMGRPNLVKISKAMKGFGWLHHVTRHGKKG